MGGVASAAVSFFSSGAGASVLGGAASALTGGLLNKKSAPAPEVKSPTTMPDPLEQQKERERSIIEQMARRGRQSTILTEPSGGSQTLGG